jgi:hypothetical protein
MEWKPISEYRPEDGHVVVWLEWSYYSRDLRTLQRDGTFALAYCIDAASGRVWVTAHDSIPCETTGRKITHYCKPTFPARDGEREKGGGK